MKYRSLGNTGIMVSEVGFGSWGIGGLTSGNTSYGETNDKISMEALRTAYEQGITFYDTANVYGYGRSEALIAEAFREHREKIVISTKAGTPYFGGKPDFSVWELEGSLDRSLKRLNTDYVDVFLLHNPPAEIFVQFPGLIAFLLGLKEKGKIKAFGISSKSARDAIEILRYHDTPVIEINFNMLDVRAVDSGLLEIAKAGGFGLIARTPLCFGFLSGSIKENTMFAEGDHRNNWPTAQHKRWIEGARQAHSHIKENGWATKAQQAIQFCLSFSEISTVIPGIMTPQEARENAAASDLPFLTQDEKSGIIKMNHEQNFFLGPQALSLRDHGNHALLE